MSEIIRFGTDGWRARLDGDFTNDNVVRVADAAGALWARRAAGALVYVGYDARPGAREFARLQARSLRRTVWRSRFPIGTFPRPRWRGQSPGMTALWAA